MAIPSNGASFKFYMQRITTDENNHEVSSETVNLEEYFYGFRYKSMTGINSFGKPAPYEESFVESDHKLVYVPPVAAMEATTLKLTAYFFPDYDAENYCDAVATDNVNTCLEDFVNFVSGAKLIYWDTARRRKVKMYLTGATEPKTEKIYGQVYKEVTFTFKNEYGRSFDISHDFMIPGGGVLPPLIADTNNPNNLNILELFVPNDLEGMDNLALYENIDDPYGPFKIKFYHERKS